MVHNSLYNFGNSFSYLTQPGNGTYVQIHEISKIEVSYLNDTRTPCQSKPREENMNNCIQHYIENQMGCQLPWHTGKTSFPKCIEPQQYQSFLQSYDEIAGLSGYSISKKTGCLPSCKRNEFTMNVRTSIAKPNGEPFYGGYFYYSGGRYKQKVYHYTYDFTSYIADVGGLVGLFLGYSMLSFYDGLKNAWKNTMLNYWK